MRSATSLTCCSGLIGVLLGACAFTASATELSLRGKAFATRSFLEEQDVQRALDGTPADDLNLDLRVLWRTGEELWQVIVDHQTIYVVGDSFAFATAPQSALDRSLPEDDQRLVDLTWTIQDGARHALVHRFDRLALELAHGPWRATFGRQALSWGSGIVFQPLDLFSPFAPTLVDREYKAGDDLLLLERSFQDGSDLQLLAVGRRGDDGESSSSASSFGFKWHVPIGLAEAELAAGRHFRDRVTGVSLRVPLGGALLRTDWLATWLDEGGRDISGIVNVDYSFVLSGRNWYTFAEYYRNGFGVEDSPLELTRLPRALIARLRRGEVFNVMRDYLALGARIEWHPLVTHSTTWIANLEDGSALLQMQVGYDRSDRQHLDAGFIAAIGDRGEEYGGIELPGGLTTGGGARLYLRWVYHL